MNQGLSASEEEKRRQQLEAQRRRRLERKKKKSNRLISRKEVVERVGLSYPTIWEMMKKDKFPRSRQLGPQKVCWYEWEIDEFIDNLPIQPLQGDTKAEVA